MHGSYYIIKHCKWGTFTYAGPMSLTEAQRMLSELSADRDATYTISD
jgi:hypothetical protein